MRLPQNLNGWTLATWALAAAMALCLFVTFALWTADTFIEAFWFPIAITVLFLVPGSQIVRWLDLDDVFTLEYVLLSLVLGMVATCSIYAVVTWIGKPRCSGSGFSLHSSRLRSVARRFSPIPKNCNTTSAFFIAARGFRVLATALFYKLPFSQSHDSGRRSSHVFRCK